MELSVPKSPLPKLKNQSGTALEDVISPKEFRDLYAEVVSLRQTLNSVLVYLKSKES